MRHQVKRHRIARSHSHRKATLAALSTALFERKRITTTLAKARALRVYVEPLIHRAKDDTTHNRRQVFRHLQSKEAVKVLFDEIGEKIGDRQGGYTRIVKLGTRAGDAAPLAMIELVDYNDVRPEGGSTGRRRTRRSRSRRGGAKGTPPAQTPAKAEGAEAKSTPPAKATTSTPAPEGNVTAPEGAPDSGAGADALGGTEEHPVAEAQTTPVPERTEPKAEAEASREDAEAAVRKQQEEASQENPDEADDEQKQA